MSTETIEIHAYDPGWIDEFTDLASRLRHALGPVARRIDHIGSTSIVGLAAKAIIDVQISVDALEPMEYRASIEGLGFVWRHDNPEKTKRYFRERPGAKRIHIHVRRAGSWHEQYALLFRDYVREHPEAARQYEAVKRRLAQQFRFDRVAYTDAKGPIFWQIMLRADRWAAATGWEVGPSDA